MALIDDIIKWFKAPKTIKGIVGMIVIVIVLALDFAYWAGAIDVTTATDSSDGDDGGEVLNWTHVIYFDDSYTGTLTIPSGGIIINEGSSVEKVPFDVVENSSAGWVNVTAQGTHLRADLDLRVYGPDGEKIAESATGEADESIEIDEKQFNRTGPGQYIAEVENYSSFNTDFTLTIQLYKKEPVVEKEEEGD